MVIQTRTGNDPGEAPLRAATQGQPGGYDPVNGTRMDQVANTLTANGVPSATMRNNQSVTDLQNATASGDPTIVHVNNPAGHFMVVDGVTSNPDGSRTINGRDPATGSNFSVPEQDLVNRGYNGWAITTN
jgi:hypothetical protein